jgi:hypothetical protein
VKAEAAKLPGAGIGPKQCPGKRAAEKRQLAEISENCEEEHTCTKRAARTMRRRGLWVVCASTRARLTNPRWWWERLVKRAFLLFRFRPVGRFLIQLSNSFKLLRVAARLVQEHASVIVYVDPEIQSSIVVSQI